MNSLDKTALRSINPNQIKAYLSHRNWVFEGKIGDFASIWHRASEEEFEYEVLIPEDVSLRDYESRVQDAIKSIANYEHRNETDILKDITNYFSDTVSIRVVHSDVENGTIPLEDGVKLFEMAKDLLSSAAMSTISKKRYFYGARSAEASSFLSKVRLGQTEIGSYIVNVLVPLDSRKERDLFDAVSFSRHVTFTLGNGLSSLKKITELQGADLMSYEGLVNAGISANMCDALIGLSGENRNRDFDVGISYSIAEENHAILNAKYYFDSKEIDKIEKISSYLKENYVIDNITLSGPVQKLDRDSREDVGTVTIVALVGDRERAVAFELSSENYHEAVQAHDKKLIVEITGDIHIGPRSARVLNAKGFRVFGDQDFFE